MRCIRPYKASLDAAGKLCRKYSEKMPGLVDEYEFVCRKCLPCRLNIAREKGVRAWHESQFHPESMFLTLTYDDRYLTSPKLVRDDIELFNKRLRSHVEYKYDRQIKIFGCGEYGDKNKRPHWHLIVFGFRPPDSLLAGQTDRGDDVWTSNLLGPARNENIGDGEIRLWNYGRVEFGSVTMDSASYVARYSGKKLVHGRDGTHDFEPIPIIPRFALGKPWIEKYWKQTFENGYVMLPNKCKTAIPRYYSDWCKKNQPEVFDYYIKNVRPKIHLDSETRADAELCEYIDAIYDRKAGDPYPDSRSKVKETILKSKFKMLQERLKL